MVTKHLSSYCEAPLVLQETRMTIKNSVPMATHSFPVPTHFMFVVFRLKMLTRPQSRANIFIGLLDHAYEVLLANIKMECQRWPEKLFIWRRSGTQYVSMVTELLSSYCRAHLVEPYSKESNISGTNWLRYLFSSYLIKIWLSI